MATTAYETILVERRAGVALITLNRPERRNAYTSQMGVELHGAFADLDADEGVRAIVVTGAGRDFCVGADLERGGDTFNRAPEATEAEDWAREHRAVERDQVLPLAISVAEDIAANTAPPSAAITKQLVYRFLTDPDRIAAQSLESQAFWWIGRQPDAVEGITSFLEKRPPRWKMSRHDRPGFLEIAT